MASSLNAINLPALWHTRGRRTNPWGAALSQAALGRTLPTGRGEKAALRHALRAFPLLNTSFFRLKKNWWRYQKTIVECSWAKWGKARGQLAELSISFSPRSAGSSKTIHNSYLGGSGGIKVIRHIPVIIFKLGGMLFCLRIIDTLRRAPCAHHCLA